MRSHGFARASALVGVAPTAAGPAPQASGKGPSVVRVVKAGDGYRLTRDGKPYVIKGAGGDGPLEALAAAGGNSLRTWGADKKLGAMLDKAQTLGLTVTVGIWLGHERHGFNYNDADQVAKQFDEARKAVLRYKDHPALLMWGIGNEMEGVGKGDNAAIWSAVNNIAAHGEEARPEPPDDDRDRRDRRRQGQEHPPALPRHRRRRHQQLRRRRARSPSVTRRPAATKPFVLTEFGPPGQWEVAKTSWGAAPEMTSTEKAAFYRERLPADRRPGRRSASAPTPSPGASSRRRPPPGTASSSPTARGPAGSTP